MLKVSIEFDSEIENPAKFDCNWSLYSFSTRHSSYKDPEELGLAPYVDDDGIPVIRRPGLRTKLRVGLAFWLSYYEHSGCLWFRKGADYPAGVEFQWDGRRLAGLLVWEHKPSEIGGKTYEERAKDADAFLKTYTDWANGNGLYYCITDEDEETGDEEEVDSCGGFYQTDEDYMLGEIADRLVGKEFEVEGPAGEHLESKLRRLVADKATAKLTAVTKG